MVLLNPELRIDLATRLVIAEGHRHLVVAVDRLQDLYELPVRYRLRVEALEPVTGEPHARKAFDAQRRGKLGARVDDVERDLDAVAVRLLERIDHERLPAG